MLYAELSLDDVRKEVMRDAEGLPEREDIVKWLGVLSELQTRTLLLILRQLSSADRRAVLSKVWIAGTGVLDLATEVVERAELKSPGSGDPGAGERMTPGG